MVDFKKIKMVLLIGSEVIVCVVNNVWVIKVFNMILLEFMDGYVDGFGKWVLFYVGDDVVVKKEFVVFVWLLNFCFVNLGKFWYGGSVM